MAARRTAHAENCLAHVRVIHRLAIDREDGITGLDARPVGWRSLDRGDHANPAVVGLQFEADTGVGAAGVDADLLVLAGIQELGVGIELGQHAADGVVHELPVGNGLHVLALNALEYFGQHPGVVGGQAGGQDRRRQQGRGVQAGGREPGQHGATKGESKAQQDPGEQGQQAFDTKRFHGNPRTAVDFDSSTGSGSRGWTGTQSA